MKTSLTPQVSANPRNNALAVYLRAIRAHKTLVLLVVLASFALGAAWLELRAPNYQATAEVLITPLPQEEETFAVLPLLRDSGDPTRTIETAATLIRSPGAADLAAERLGGAWSAEDVLRAVNIEPSGESDILTITATTGDSASAADVANAFARAALDQRNRELRPQLELEISKLEARRAELEDDAGSLAAETDLELERLNALLTGGDPTVSLSQPATAPSSAEGPSRLLIIPLVALAGLTLASGVAVVLDTTDRRVADEEELTALCPAPILAVVPPLKRRERRLLEEPGWYASPAVREAFRTLIAQIDARVDRPCTILVTSASGGDGKTTSALNLATSLALAGRSVVLLDFDLRKPSIGVALGLEAQSPLPLLNRDASGLGLPDLVVEAPGAPTLSVLATKSAQGSVAVLEGISRRFPELIEQARALADYVVIDTPPLGEVSDALRVAQVSDAIILVARPGNTDRLALELTVELLKRLERSPIGMILIGRAAHPSYGYGGTSLAGSTTSAPGARVAAGAVARDAN